MTTRPSPQSSSKLWERARQHFPGGVNSPVRAFASVGGDPVFFKSARGPHLFDVTGKKYTDFVLAWGPHILGHGHPAILRAAEKSLKASMGFGAPHGGEILLAEEIKKHLKWVERLRFTVSGTEAVMTALRLSRAATGRDMIIKFEGGYHGHSDSLLVKSGSGVATLGLPDSPGVPRALAGLTLVAPFGDLMAVRSLLSRHKGRVAAVITEPVCGNMGVIAPRPGFLQGLRNLCDEHGAHLIFDEVMAGFRAYPADAATAFGVQPDLVVLGKIIGGGFPVAALGGSAALLGRLAPEGPVYQAGTLAGHPLGMAAGAALLNALTPAAWSKARHSAETIAAALVKHGATLGLPLTVNQHGAMFTAFFCEGPVCDWGSAKKSSKTLYSRFFHSLLSQGVYFPPSPFEAAFTSAAHNPGALAPVLRAIPKALAAVQK